MFQHQFDSLEKALIEGDLDVAEKVLKRLGQGRERLSDGERLRLDRLQTAYLGIANVSYRPDIVH